jgi:hypothetical protein
MKLMTMDHVFQNGVYLLERDEVDDNGSCVSERCVFVGAG